MQSIYSERHPKPTEGKIAGRQPSDDLLASPQAEGLAVAPGAEQSAPATNEIDEELARLRSDVWLDRKRIADLFDEIERRSEDLRAKARRLVELETTRPHRIELAA